MARNTTINSLICCFYSSQKHFGLLVCIGFLTFNRLVPLLVLIIHDLPLQSFVSLVNSLADGVPILVHERCPASSVSHLCGVDGRTHQFPFMRTQTELVRSFPKKLLPGSLLYHCRIVVNCCKLPEPVHYSEATFLQRSGYDHLDWAVAIFLLVCQKLEAHGPYRHTFLAVPRALENT